MKTRTVKDVLIESLDKARRYNSESQIAPIAVLWPDGASQWLSVVMELRDQLPILTLGEYDPATSTGPAIWIRAELAKRADADNVPIVYLPGYSKDHLRHIEEAPKTIEPLAYLQYRGAMFLQYNGKDWTIPAFFQNVQNGLGLDVDQSQATRSGLVKSATRLLGRSVEELRSHAGGIDASFLSDMLVSDPRRSILEWINDADASRQTFDDVEWDAFSSMLRTQYGVDPEKDGPVTAARRLGESSSDHNWNSVWNRYVESPQSYPNIPNMMHGAKPASTIQKGLFDSPSQASRWPQDNVEAENALRAAFTGVGDLMVDDARQAILELEEQHGSRRQSVWAKLGQAPLAFALEHLALIATRAAEPFPAGTVEVMQDAFTDRGWKIDAAAIDAVTCVESLSDRSAVDAALHTIYTPWLWKVATHFQEAIGRSYKHSSPSPLQVNGGTCVLFADGLRYDLAAKLSQQLAEDGLKTDLGSVIGPLPGVTSSAKPAQSPIADHLVAGDGLTLNIRETGVTLRQQGFETLLKKAGWQFLSGEVTGKPSSDARSWTEFGNIDSYGHNHTKDLARQTRSEINRLRQRVQELLSAGWSQVKVITDHGWLLTPRPMEKKELPQHLTDIRKGRCARISHSAPSDIQTLPWAWDPDVRIAFSPGISCFEDGKRYEHGGLSLQECVVPELAIARGDASSASRSTVSIVDIVWRGLRCTIELSGASETMIVDIRQQAGDASSSIVLSPAQVQHAGARVVIEDDLYEGEQAEVVVLDANGAPVAQRVVTVGGV